MSRAFYLCLSLPLLIPPAVFALCALTAGLSPAETWTAMIAQVTADRQSLLMLLGMGMTWWVWRERKA